EGRLLLRRHGPAVEDDLAALGLEEVDLALLHELLELVRARLEAAREAHDRDGHGETLLGRVRELDPAIDRLAFVDGGPGEARRELDLAARGRGRRERVVA